MVSNIIISEILGNDNFINDIFDEVRIIEGGGTHRLCQCINGEIKPREGECFSFWDRKEKCQNCVSKKASEEDRQMVKLEYFDGKYFFVIARPVVYKGKKYIVEFLSNITKELVTEKKESNHNSDDFVNDLIFQLEKVTQRDSFTGLFNKKHFEEELKNTLERVKISKEPLYLAMIDIDDFKTVNDTYGHIAGDGAILKLAQVMKSYVPHSKGSVCRFGGDEFSIIFYNVSEDECKDIMENISKEMKNTKLNIENQNFSIEISYGYFNIQSADTIERAIHMTDEILYNIKNKKKLSED